MQNRDIMTDFIRRVEDGVAFLPCVSDALNILHDELEENLIIHQEWSGDMGYFLRISRAMVPALAELDRIKENLEDVITAIYKQKKEG